METPIFRKADIVPTVSELYKIHSIIWTLIYHFHKIVHHIWWAHRANLSQPHTATERSENAASLCSPARVHIITLTGSIPEAPEVQIPPYYGHTAVVPTVSALEGLHCIHSSFFV